MLVIADEYQFSNIKILCELSLSYFGKMIKTFLVQSKSLTSLAFISDFYFAPYLRDAIYNYLIEHLEVFLYHRFLILKF